jgi:glycosyltransferase involved in cell wall biosynthesis
VGGAIRTERETEPSGPGAPFDVMVVSTFAFDEPIEEILAAASDLPDVSFHVTGDPSRGGRRVQKVPANVRLTGYLPDAQYRELLRRSGAVMCLTTRDHTMQRGACEALWAGKPIVTSDWPLLRQAFDRGAVHVRASAASIRDGVEEVRRNRARYVSEIAELRARHRSEWEEGVASLAALVHGAVRSRRQRKGR